MLNFRHRMREVYDQNISKSFKENKIISKKKIKIF